MKKLFVAALLATGCIATTAALADERESERAITLAVFGDWPYNQNLLDNAPLLVKSINADRAVDVVLHVGDIHSGSQPCTSAGILPTIATADPGWNQRVYFQFQQFNAPMVYTPGDNEWTDCHKAKEKSAGDPLKELASVRSLFFARPGHSLGLTDKRLHTQAHHFNHAYPADAQFVENVMWEDARVQFVTVNMPGSNNDTLPWTGNFTNAAAQAQEVAERTDADIRWLQAAFERAEASHARAVVIGLQADMWDPAAVAPGADGLFNYTRFVRALADLSLHFRRPVLLINGDSHLYGADRPLADPASAAGRIHGTAAVPNLTRITVQGSTNGPAEWLRLTIDPRSAAVFSWENVAYCKDPLGSCQ
ncbi:MAG: metallophosphoesterase [Burkholderiales bacterium]